MLALLLAAALAAPVDSFTIDDTTYAKPRTIWLHRTPSFRADDYRLFVFIGDWYLDDIAANAAADAAGGSAVVAIVSTAELRPADIVNRARFAQMIVTDVMPALRKKLGGLPPPDRVVVGGASFGGPTSAYLAFHHPELFGNVIAQSGAFWRGNEGTSEPPEWLTDQYRRSPLLPIRFYVEVGAEEKQVAPNGLVFIEPNRRFRDMLAAKKYAFQYVEVPGAKHNPEHWRAALGAAIAYVSQPLNRPATSSSPGKPLR